jgi:plastocyanin
MISRRWILRTGGGLTAALLFGPKTVRAADPIEIVMGGRPDGSHVWFDPIGLHVEPGQTVRWVNRDAGNSHTATAYHPDNFGRPRRIPSAANPWDSDYLLPGESFSITLTKPGVYDYYCVPHEHAGMVGRIIVGAPEAPGWTNEPLSDGDLPDAALRAFPTVAEIISKGLVRRA